MFLPLYTLIVTILILTCFVIIYFISKKMVNLREDIRAEHNAIRVEMRDEYQHLLNNIKNINKGMLSILEEKHEKIESVGEKYINDMLLIKKENDKKNCVRAVD